MKPTFIQKPILLIAVVCFSGLSSNLFGTESQSVESWLQEIQSADDNVRLQARKKATQFGAKAVAPLGKLLNNGNLNIAVTARASLEIIVHHAGRPGGGEERGDVCQALRTLLESDPHLNTQREGLFLLSCIAGDKSVALISSRLGHSDRHVREAARTALETIPGSASIQALIQALDKAEAKTKPAFLYSLTKKNHPKATQALLRYAKVGNADGLRLHALECLARKGEVQSIGLFESAIKAPGNMGLERLWSEYLRLADLIAESVDQQRAISLYKNAFANAPLAHQREHALHGATKKDGLAQLGLIVQATGDAGKRVRRKANRLLAKLEGPEVVQALRKAFATRPVEERPGLLLVLASKDPEGSQALIRAASQAQDSALKIAALSALGKLNDPNLKDVYAQLSKTGPTVIRPVAIEGLLSIAKGKLEQNQTTETYQICQQILSSEQASTSQHSRALSLALATSSPESLKLASHYLSDPNLGIEAARGGISVAKKIGKKPDQQAIAKEILEKIMNGKFPSTIVLEAVSGLKDLGFDPLEKLKKQGFILEWMSTTPILHTGPEDASKDHFPVPLYLAKKDFGYDKVHRIGARRIRWRELKQLTSDGKLDLLKLFRRTQNVLIYAYKEIEVDKDQKALFKIGSDDGAACWLNGKKVYNKMVPRGYVLDQDTVQVDLKKGKNRILFKIFQGVVGWEFSFRVTDTTGKGLDLSQQ